MKNSIALFGFGKTNQAILETSKYTFDIFDDNFKKINFDNKGNKFYPSCEYNKLKDLYHTQIITPGLPPHNELLSQASNPISDFDYFCNDFPFSIWISGTNGKTTTTQMIYHLLENNICQMGSNIGHPIALMDREKPIWVLEVSSFSMHYTNQAHPNIYLLLPIKDDHISWHGDFDNYKNAKLKPLYKMTSKDVAIIPSEYKNITSDAHIIYYDDTTDLANKMNINIKHLAITKPFDLSAVLALSVQKILFDTYNINKCNTFTIDNHKMQKIVDSYNRIWINDSKATNISASIEAINVYKNKRIHLILGGDSKGVSLYSIINYISDKNITVYAIGDSSSHIQQLCDQLQVNCKLCKILLTAIEIINNELKKDEIAILSPACASLDQFDSYSHRGDIFIENIKKL
jgi:UDP-N-acetylmuramoylalanine--D-glutamate ligase